MKGVLVGAVISGIAVMVWGFVFWAGGIGNMGFSQMTADQEQAVREVFDRQIPESGTYVMPNPEGMGTDDFAARHLAGPLAFLHVTKAGMDPMSPTVYLLGFLHMGLTALLLGMAMRALPGMQRYWFGLLVGVLVAFWSNMSDPVWFYQPWGYHLTTSMYDIVAFGIMGAIQHRVLRE